MKCPIDGVELVMSERQGIEIDYCPTCRGVWLDRGELDKIIERAVPPEASAALHQPQPLHQPQQYAAPRPAPRRDHDDDDDDYRGRDYKDYSKKKRRGSFLDDLFDF